jgi:hypothetical protein
VSVLKRLLADRRPPAEATRPLARDERVLAWARTEGGGTVLATQLGLWLPARPDAAVRSDVDLSGADLPSDVDLSDVDVRPGADHPSDVGVRSDLGSASGSGPDRDGGPSDVDGAPGRRGSERIGWHLVDKAVWRGGTLTVIAAEDPGDGVLVELPPRSVRLAEPRDLPPTVRARVERSIAYTRHHKLAPAGGVRVVGRRVPGRDGLSWQLVFDAGTDRNDPLLRVQTDELLAAARAETASTRLD